MKLISKEKYTLEDIEKIEEVYSKVGNYLKFVCIDVANGYSERFIEFIRTNEKYLFNSLSGAQIISLFMIVIGIYFLMNPLNKSVSDTS